jgi:hypothetical protein
MKRVNLAAGALLAFGASATSLCWAAAPVVWGQSVGAKGCVILRESEKLEMSSSNDNTGTVAASHFQLDVITSKGYSSLVKTSWTDDQATINELQRTAAQDQTRLVELKDPYSPEDLEAAQSLCRQAMTSVP